jgi:hypothetical protein
METRKNASSGAITTKPTDVPTIADTRMARAASGNQGFGSYSGFRGNQNQPNGQN